MADVASPVVDSEKIVEAAVDRFVVQPKEKFISTGQRSMRVRQETEERMTVGGKVFKVTVDASGTVTHIEEDHGQHAIARPATMRYKKYLVSPTVRMK